MSSEITPREHLLALRKQVLKESSPFRPGILAAIQDLNYALANHENFVDASPPMQSSETALGHKPKGRTVAANSTHTDAALAALDCSD